MIYGVFSDVHSNYEALKVVLYYFRSHRVSSYICCGDLVGYGPQPNECIDAVAGLPDLRCVSGNHDLGVVGELPLKWFNSAARCVIESTAKEISAKSREYLDKLPKMVEEGNFTLVHGSPKSPAEEYLLTGEQFLENTDRWRVSPCFIGHSHIGIAFTQKGVRFPVIRFLEPEQKLVFEPETRYMINPGAVGQPRDRNPKASCGIYDSKRGSFELARLDYPVLKTQELMREKGLPQMLIDRLSFGW